MFRLSCFGELPDVVLPKIAQNRQNLHFKNWSKTSKNWKLWILVLPEVDLTKITKSWLLYCYFLRFWAVFGKTTSGSSPKQDNLNIWAVHVWLLPIHKHVVIYIVVRNCVPKNMSFLFWKYRGEMGTYNWFETFLHYLPNFWHIW